MKCAISISVSMKERLLEHFFQNHLEQGAFVFARAVDGTEDSLRLEATEMYLIPPEGWAVQLEVYLEMKDAERAKIMKIARDGGYAVLDCHSHPGSHDRVEFSESDRAGINDFAAYAKWKLSGQPYAAMVWGEESVDAVIWYGNFDRAHSVQEVLVADRDVSRVLIPRGTWFSPRSLRGRKLRLPKHGE